MPNIADVDWSPVTRIAVVDLNWECFLHIQTFQAKYPWSHVVAQTLDHSSHQMQVEIRHST